MSEVTTPLPPKFLNNATANLAINLITEAIQHPMIQVDLRRNAFHIVVLVPKMEIGLGSHQMYSTQPHTLAEYSHNKNLWPQSANYDKIAHCKALQLWYGNADGGTDTKPHLLFSGDTPFWGGVKRDGIVVACSGVQPYFDRMISGMVADICIAYAYHAWATSRDKEKGVDFLTNC
jgi:hypothetical protein